MLQSIHTSRNGVKMCPIDDVLRNYVTKTFPWQQSFVKEFPITQYPIVLQLNCFTNVFLMPYFVSHKNTIGHYNSKSHCEIFNVSIYVHTEDYATNFGNVVSNCITMK